MGKSRKTLLSLIDVLNERITEVEADIAAMDQDALDDVSMTAVYKEAINEDINQIYRDMDDFDHVSLRIEERLTAIEGQIAQQFDPYMTAIQFASHNELDESVNLNYLGRLVHKEAGASYRKLPHVKFGTVGYAPISAWTKAYEVLVSHKGMYSLFDYMACKGLEVTQGDRKIIEAIATTYSFVQGKPTSVGFPTKRHPQGVPTFTSDAIDEAITWLQ